jgi:hypothetical protein
MVTVRIHQLPPWQRSVTSAVVAAVALVVVALAAPAGGSFLPVALVVAAALAALAVRVPRLRVETGADVVVVNLLRTHRLAWPDVERFAVGRGGVELRRAGGGRVPVHAFPAVAGLTRSAELRLDLAAEGLERARRRRSDAARTVDVRSDAARTVDVRSDDDRSDAPRRG